MKKTFSCFDRKIVVALFVSVILITGAVFTSNSLLINKVSGAGEQPGGGGPGGGGSGSGQEGSGSMPAGDICGFAWGATSQSPTPKMGVGWISFNSKDCDTDENGTISPGESAANPGCPAGGTSDYKVSMDTDGNITGYAWSSNLGWLRFGALSDFPNTGGNNQQDARISSGSTGSLSVSGWGRFCAGTTSGNCSSMASRNDGWAGWLSLRGSAGAGSYGVNFDTAKETFSGYSWGGPVVGWINWNPGTGNGVRYCSSQTLTASLSASPNRGSLDANGNFNTTLTATPHLSAEQQKQLAKSKIIKTAHAQGLDDYTYEFRCNTNLPWSTTRNSPIYPDPSKNEVGCQYHNTGTFTPGVRITYNGLTAVGSTAVRVLGFVDETGGLNLTCSANPAMTGEPVTWRAEVNPEGVAQPAYTFTFTFSDEPESPKIITAPITEAFATYEKTYTTLGNKSLHVEVADSGSASDIYDCSTNIIVRPIIKEI